MEEVEVSISDYESKQAKRQEQIKQNMRQTNDKKKLSEDKERNELRLLLAARSPHLPGYNWFSDWIQWMRNNHPLLGICCKYRENPIGIGQRIIILIGSISFGLTATNGVFLYFRVWDEQNGVIVRMEWEDKIYDVTYEMVVLWTLGSLLHSIIDLAVWYIAACSCCMPGGLCDYFEKMRFLGKCISIYICASFAAVAIVLSLMRANFEEAQENGGIDNTNTTTALNELTDLEIETINSFSFLVGYFTELVLVYFIYFPVIATIIFSGCLRPCLPCIGGRPGEIKKQERKRSKKAVDDQRPFIDERRRRFT